MGNKIVKKNLRSTVLLQIITIICGLIVPRQIIGAFGSELNGLCTSITQALNYLSLLEGGVTGVLTAALYKPLFENDMKKVSALINAANSFFQKIGLFFMIYTVVIGVIYPLFFAQNYSFSYVFFLTIILGCTNLIQYFFSLSLKLLLNSDGKVYVVSTIHILAIIVNATLVVICCIFVKDIIVVKAFSALAFVIHPVLYSVYIKKNYCLDKTQRPDKGAITQRWDGFGQTLAFFIHTNTDVALLTIFSKLSLISVYSIYLLIVSALNNIIAAITNAVVPSIGRLYASGNIKATNEAFGIYEFSVYYVSTVLFSCASILIVPFVSIYTRDINDVNYCIPSFGLAIVVAEMLFCYRDPYVSMVYIGGHFKETKKYAYIEAGINVILSSTLVIRFGLTGIAIGTAIAMLYRIISQVFYLSSHIIYRRKKCFFKNITVFSSAFIVVNIVSNYLLVITYDNYISWIVSGMKVFLISFIVVSLFSVVFCNKEVRGIFNGK